MDAISRVIKKILNQNPGLQHGLEDARILELWAPTVGEAIARHTRAIQIRDQTLIIEVDHPIWQQELLANKKLALEKLNERIAKELGIPASPPKIVDLYFNGFNSARRKASPGQK